MTDIIVASGDILSALAQMHLGSASRWVDFTLVISAMSPPLDTFEGRIRAGHTAPDGSPLIFPGDILRAKQAEAIGPDTHTGKSKSAKSGASYKKQWAGVSSQSPNPRIAIHTTGDPKNADIIYKADASAGQFSRLLSYSFSESVEDFEGAFSFSVESGEGQTIFDRVPIRSIVKIFEGSDDKPAFVGIIRRRNFSTSMGAQGVQRAITFSGKSITSLVADFQISLDNRISGVANATAKDLQLRTALTESPLSIIRFIELTQQHFFSISDAMAAGSAGGVTNTEVRNIINSFLGKNASDYVTVGGSEQQIKHNISTTLINESTNSLLEMWRNILPQPVYEVFSYCKNGEPKIMVRRVPFGEAEDGSDWSSLDIFHISPAFLTSYELEQSDEEVYTVFSSFVVGSAMSREFWMAVSQADNDNIIQRDRDKIAIYGFRMLQADFLGYNRRGNAEGADSESVKSSFEKLNKNLAYWYSRLDEMYYGSVTVITDFNQPYTNPRAGCRAKFLGGEFYIEKTEHKWVYGATPIIKLTLTRGLMYDENGIIKKGSAGEIKGVDSLYAELRGSGKE